MARCVTTFFIVRHLERKRRIEINYVSSNLQCVLLWPGVWLHLSVLQPGRRRMLCRLWLFPKHVWLAERRGIRWLHTFLVAAPSQWYASLSFWCGYMEELRAIIYTFVSHFYTSNQCYSNTLWHTNWYATLCTTADSNISFIYLHTVIGYLWHIFIALISFDIWGVAKSYFPLPLENVSPVDPHVYYMGVVAKEGPVLNHPRLITRMLHPAHQTCKLSMHYKLTSLVPSGEYACLSA